MNINMVKIQLYSRRYLSDVFFSSFRMICCEVLVRSMIRDRNLKEITLALVRHWWIRYPDYLYRNGSTSHCGKNGLRSLLCKLIDVQFIALNIFMK